MTVLIKRNIKIELEDIGEGWHGDYDPNDMKDEHLLRFTFYRYTKEQTFEPIPDCSYCTRLPTTIELKEKIRALDILMKLFDRFCIEEDSAKRACERLSWIDKTWLNRRL